jgi:peptidylprolyl isomerase
MIWSFMRVAFLAFLVAVPSFLPAQEPNSPAIEESAADGVGSKILDTAAETETAKAPSGETAAAGSEPGQSAPIAPTADPSPDKESSVETINPQGTAVADEQAYREEFAKRIAKFNETRLQLEQAIWEQREIFIKYSNHDDRTPAAKESFFAQRQEVRKRLDETYLAALDVCRMGPDQDTATFLVTMIQHRFERDIYDASTMEGAARMIDGGAQLTYLFQAAARSAVVVGDFDMAKKLFDVIDDEQKEDIDQALAFYLESFRESFEEEKAEREKEAKEDRLPRVLLRTTQGDVLVELFLDSAPSTVSHFISLVEEGFYDGLDFYQVIDHLLALTGDPSGVGDGNCGKYIMDEHQNENAREGFRGSLVMAKLPMGDTGKFVPNSASSQFAILLLPVKSVAEEQTVFGRVIEGMDAISRMRRIDPSKKKEKGAIVQPPDMIIEATVVRRPETLPEPRYMQFGSQGLRPQ